MCALVQYEWNYLNSVIKSHSKLKIDEKLYAYYEKLWPMKYLFLEFIQKTKIIEGSYFCDLLRKIIENNFHLIFHNLNEDNAIFDKIKTNSIMNLTILSQNLIFYQFIIQNLDQSNIFLDKLCKTLTENILSTKLRQHLQLLIIAIFYSIKGSKQTTNFLQCCVGKNLQNYNLNYQTNASLIIIASYIILILLNESDLAINNNETIEQLLEKILVYNSHHFHAVKITAQTLVVSIWENQNLKEKLMKFIKNKSLLYQMEMISNFVLNNKELFSIYSSHKFLKQFDILEEISVINLILQLEESSNYCNIFVKYKKSKKFCMSLYENIKKTIASVFDFNVSNKNSNSIIEIDSVSFQNRNKVSIINDVFHEIKSNQTDKNIETEYDFIVIASFLENLPNIAGFLL